jgi:hypothetical protein
MSLIVAVDCFRWLGNMPGESATDLIGRLFSYTPTLGREPLEDYCTECLAWLLKESVEFREHFFRLLGLEKLRVEGISVSIHTQFRFEEQERGIIDLLIRPEDGDDFILAVESKIEAALGQEQLCKYRRWLDGAMKGRYKERFLVSITDKHVSSPLLNARMQWGDVQEQLERFHFHEPGSQIIGRSFAEFLKTQGIVPLRMETLTDSFLGDFKKYRQFQKQMDAVLYNFSKEKPFGESRLSRIQTTEDSAYWRGVYSVSKRYYAGFGIRLVENPCLPLMFLWVEFQCPGKWDNLLPPPEFEWNYSKAQIWRKETERDTSRFIGNNTYLPFSRPLDDKLNGNAEEMLGWFRDITQVMVEYLAGHFRP